MCNFCECILKDDELVEKNAIIYNRKYNDFHIEVPDADSFCGGVLRDVKFCPYCGESLDKRKGELR